MSADSLLDALTKKHSHQGDVDVAAKDDACFLDLLTVELRVVA